ncbi:MAG: c-type cytochrome [Solirubrobacterales bacterium]
MRLIALPAILVVAIAAAGCGGSGDAASVPSTPAPTTSEKAGSKDSASSADAEGKQVFVANCSTCHTLSDAGANGMAGPNLDELRPSEATVKSKVTNGGGGMPAFAGTLDPGQIDAVSAYVASVAGK